MTAPPPLAQPFSRAWRVCLAGVLACLAAHADADADERGRTRAVMVAAPPRIDGGLSDPAWQKAPALGLHAAPGKEGTLATTARVLFGPRDLFVAVECQDPDPQFQAKVKDRDGQVWTDDCVELYVLPHPKIGYKHITVNPLGTVFDQSCPLGARAEKSWNADLKVAVSVQPGKGWKVAVSIPYRDLGAYAGKDQTWRFNVTRVRKARGRSPAQEYTWAMLPTAEFHQPDAFGVIEHIDVAAQAGGATRQLEEFHSGLQWMRLRDPPGVRRCFAHPLDPRIAWCAADSGLLATADDGRTWKPVAPADAQAVGEVTCLAVCIGDPDVLCFGTDQRGLFLSTDGGKSFKPLGRGDERLACDHVEWVAFCPSDPTGRTLLATHGLSAPGMSISRDLGATWEVLGRDRFLGRFVKQAETIIAVGSMLASAGKAWGIHRSGTDGLRWEETVRDVRPAVPVATPGRWQFLAATLGGAILQSFNDGKSWTKLLESEGSTWTGLFFTSGPTDEAEVLAAYDPHRQGLCLSRHRFSNGLGEKHNAGLYIGPYVKSGASCVANANGTVYYVAMNNALWIGRWALPADGPGIVQAWCEPCAARSDNTALLRARDELHSHIAAIADDPGAPGPDGHVRAIARAARTIDGCESAMRFTVLARVSRRAGTGGLRAVTVDASKAGGGKATPLFDDGKHGDDKPGDGLWAASVDFSPALFQRADFRETSLLTVTAVGAEGGKASWPAVVHIPRPRVPVGIMHGGWDCDYTEGPATVRLVGREGVDPKANALRFEATGPGPWRAAWISPGDGVNCAGYKWLSFYIRCDADPHQEVFAHLMDHHKIGGEGFLDVPHFSQAAPLIAGGYLKALGRQYQKVRIPIDKLLPKGVFFLRWHTTGIGLSAPKGAKPGVYCVDMAQIEP